MSDERWERLRSTIKKTRAEERGECFASEYYLGWELALEYVLDEMKEIEQETTNELQTTD
jgi:hypothetical protein